jgi:glycosyltransferase involved in cell wall biosynthesis
MIPKKIQRIGEAPRLFYLETEDWAFCQHRMNLARAAKEAGWRVGLLAPAGDRASDIRAEGFDFFPLNLKRTGINLRQETGTVAEIAAIYRRERPALVHNVSLKSALYGSIAARLAGVPAVVNSITGLGYVFIGNGLRRKVLRVGISGMLRLSLGRENQRCVFQNPDDLALLAGRQIVKRERCSIIRGSGVDTKRFRPNPDPAGPPVVFLASRLLWDKGIGELVEAARVLKGEGLAFRLILAGEPDPANPASIPGETLMQWQKEGIAELPGYIRDMAGFLSGVHVACLPSYREGLPLFLLEAMASGRPCVTTDVPGCREAVSHGENGLLVPVRESRALADALRALILDPALRGQMGKKGRERAEKEFSKEQVADSFIHLYRSLSGVPVN